MADIKAGKYAARGIEGSAQTGKQGDKQTDTVKVDVFVPELNRALSVFLYFTDKSEKFSLERLRAMGWDGSPDPAFRGISTNEIEIEVKYEPNPNKGGELGLKVEIVTGGTATLKEPMSEKESRGFMARLAAADKASRPSGSPGGGAPSGSGGGGPSSSGGKLAL